MNKLNLDHEFIQWYHHDDYSGFAATREMYATEHNNWAWWMRAAYRAGAQRMAQDMLDTLAHYAAAVEGLDPELLTPDEVYDRARENLFSYVTKVLDERV